MLAHRMTPTPCSFGTPTSSGSSPANALRCSGTAASLQRGQKLLPSGSALCTTGRPTVTPPALPAIVTATQQFAAALTAADAEAALQQRRDWIHAGERPSPTLSRRLRPPQDSTHVAALRAPNGRLLTAGTALAQRTVQYWAGVSAQPQTDPAAQREVLQAMAAGRHLSAAAAASLDNHFVSPEEVRAALRKAPSGKSAGHDGIPVELWRKFKTSLAPLLARVYTAINTTGMLPARFSEGLIVTLYKSGDRADPANYRPITLLCTDYKIYAKILSRRLGPHLASIIDPEQTAFVPGRRIGENILTLQCLTALLRLQGRSAIAVICDFRKAYDTLDRDFLYAAMAALGCGAAFVAMVRRLLTDTTARAHVNGYTSTLAAFEAGVRQGCPLAPLLYLFFAQGLLALLRARGVGIDVAGRRLTATQYADDAQPLIPSVNFVPAVIAALDTFGDATGQRLNHDKTQLLPIGVICLRYYERPSMACASSPAPQCWALPSAPPRRLPHPPRGRSWCSA